jgi:hypothetical protein
MSLPRTALQLHGQRFRAAARVPPVSIACTCISPLGRAGIALNQLLREPMTDTC